MFYSITLSHPPITFACSALPSLLILAWTNMFPAHVHHVSSAYASSTINGRWVHEDTCPGFCDSSSWLLQHGTCQLTEVCDRQTTTGAERRRTSCQWQAQVRPWTVTDSTCRLALARCGRSGPVQAWCYSPPMSPQQSAAVSGRLLCSSLRHRQSSATMFCRLLLADHTIAHSAVGHSQLPDPLSWTCFQTNSETPAVLSLHSDTKDILLQPVLVCSRALEVLQLCAI